MNSVLVWPWCVLMKILISHFAQKGKYFCYFSIWKAEQFGKIYHMCEVAKHKICNCVLLSLKYPAHICCYKTTQGWLDVNQINLPFTMITILNVMQPELSNWNQGSQKSWEISLLSEKELLFDQSSWYQRNRISDNRHFSKNRTWEVLLLASWLLH